jgi:hypothetical protein
MATLIVDGREQPAGGPAKTLGDLVAAADERSNRAGRIVTALRLDGVDEPAFRERHVTARTVGEFARIEIESGTPADLAGECLAEAGMALQTLADAAETAALRFYAGSVETANHELGQITAGIGTALAIVGAASLGIGVDLASLVTPEGGMGELTTETSTYLEALIEAQLQADWTATAGLLESSLAPALRRWGAACSALAPGVR